MKKNFLILITLVVFISGGNSQTNTTTKPGQAEAASTATLAKPYATKSSVNFSKVTGWLGGKTPEAPEGFTVTRFAEELKSARWIYVLPNGDVLVAQANTHKRAGKDRVISTLSGQAKSQHIMESPNQITLFRDSDKNGTAETKETFLWDLNQPFGMLLIDNSFYVACTDGLWKFSYTTGDTKIKGEGKKILDLPAGGYNNHWTRNLVTNKSKTKIYISVGSGSNIGENGMEHEVRRANIIEINPDGSGERIYASGLRNPVGMDWAPGTDVLWTAVNERDGLGDELVPDYMTSVKDGGFYGWPYSYFGQNPDPRIAEKDRRPDLVSKAIVPDVSLDAHTASLGLAFYTKSSFPEKYRNGAFIGQHGSWNRKELSGYKVVFVPFSNGKPSGPPEDFLTGFVANADKSQVYGRPVGVAVLPDGSLLVADDAGDMVWKVSYKK